MIKNSDPLIPSAVRLKTLVIAFVPTAILIYASYRFVDTGVARAAQGLLLGYGGGQGAMPQIPDLLLPVVIAVTAVGWGGRLVLSGRSSLARLRSCLALLGIVAPLSYGAKVILKLVFGRIRTRDWLLHPQWTGFHWFHGTGNFNGFPSGHMTVFAALVAVLWRYYPRYRPLFGALLAVLAAALILLDYHFVSDVIAGTYCGVLVYWVAWSLFEKIKGVGDN